MNNISVNIIYKYTERCALTCRRRSDDLCHDLRRCPTNVKRHWHHLPLPSCVQAPIKLNWYLCVINEQQLLPTICHLRLCKCDIDRSPTRLARAWIAAAKAKRAYCKPWHKSGASFPRPCHQPGHTWPAPDAVARCPFSACTFTG